MSDEDEAPSEPQEGDLVVYYTDEDETVEGEVEKYVADLGGGKHTIEVGGDEINVEWDDDYGAWHEVQK